MSEHEAGTPATDPARSGDSSPPPGAAAAPAPAARRDPAWVRALEEPVERFLSAFRLPLAAALFIAAGTMWVYGDVVRDQEDRLGRIMNARAGELQSWANLQLELRWRALDDLARTWEARPKPDLDAWQYDAEILLRRNMQYRAVAWLAPDLSTVAIQPTTANLPGWAFGPAGDEARLRTLSSMVPQTGAGFSSSYVLPDGERQILVRAPMHGPEGRTAFLIGVIRPHDLIDVLVGRMIRAGYSVAVFEGPYLMFGENWSAGGEETRWTREVEVGSGELGLRLRLWPSEDLLARVRTGTPRRVLIGGLLLALFVALLVRRTEVLSERLRAAGR